MAASGGKRRHPAAPSSRELTALAYLREDDDDGDAEAEAGEGGHHGASSRQKVSSKGKIPGLQTGVRSGPAKKKKKDTRDTSGINNAAAINSSDEDDLLMPKLSQHRLSSSKAGEPEPIAGSSSRGFILGKYTAVINKFVTAYTLSIVGRVFHSSEANHVRDEALCLAAVTLNIFASADEYEQHIREHPAEFAQWKRKNNASVRQAASVSIQNTCD